MSKLGASIMSALFMTTINTIYSEYEKNNDSVLYYSFLSKFGMGFIILFSFFFFIGIPVSIIVDRYIQQPTNRLLKIIAYSLSGAAVGGIFLTINPTTSMSGGLSLILQFGIAGLIFGLFQTIMERSNKSKYNR